MDEQETNKINEEIQRKRTRGQLEQPLSHGIVDWGVAIAGTLIAAFIIGILVAVATLGYSLLMKILGV